MLIDKQMSEKIKIKRIQTGLTQIKAAKMIGIAGNTYIKYEKGHFANIWTLAEIMKFFGLDYMTYFKKHKRDFKIIIDEETDIIYTVHDINVLTNTSYNYKYISENEDDLLSTLITGYHKSIGNQYNNYLNNLKNKSFFELYGTQKRGYF